MNKAIIPIMFSFFVMGFVDVVGISTSFVKIDFELTDSLANLLPMMVFLWFGIFALPTGVMMNKYGRKNTVLFSALLTTVAMLLPLIHYSFPIILLAFAMLGIGNTVLQVSLNPLVTNVVLPQHIPSTLTFGQFVKAICSFAGPIIVATAAGVLGNWKWLFLVYAILSLVSFVWLLLTPVPLDVNKTSDQSFSQVLALLKNRYTLLLFSIIVLIVGFEVGLVTALPKYLSELHQLSLEQGAYMISLYFIARTIGAFLGAIVLSRFNPKKVLLICMVLAVGFYGSFLLFNHIKLVYITIFMIGLLCANVFAIVFADGLQCNKERANEISGLMIMGVAGGALVPPLMGIVADNFNHWTSLLLPFACLVYICIASSYMYRRRNC